MRASDLARAIGAATSIVSSLGLTVRDSIVLHNSNKITLRLLPCDLVARVAPGNEVAADAARFELDLARQLVAAGCPIATAEARVEPRVYEQDGFAITFWTYYEPATPFEISPIDYADALKRLHTGMRTIDLRTPHFTDRVEEAQELAASRERTPFLEEDDRQLLADTLESLRQAVADRGADQLLHGEPHPGNLLSTRNGPLFIDLETCCRGPVEFDLAHAPEAVAEHYLGVDQRLLRDCRILVLAMITMWRWDRTDQLPNGRQLATEWLAQIRAAFEKRERRT